MFLRLFFAFPSAQEEENNARKEEDRYQVDQNYLSGLRLREENGVADVLHAEDDAADHVVVSDGGEILGVVVVAFCVKEHFPGVDIGDAVSYDRAAGVEGDNISPGKLGEGRRLHEHERTDGVLRLHAGGLDAEDLKAKQH